MNQRVTLLLFVALGLVAVRADAGFLAGQDLDGSSPLPGHPGDSRDRIPDIQALCTGAEGLQATPSVHPGASAGGFVAVLSASNILETDSTVGFYRTPDQLLIQLPISQGLFRPPRLSPYLSHSA